MARDYHVRTWLIMTRCPGQIKKGDPEGPGNFNQGHTTSKGQIPKLAIPLVSPKGGVVTWAARTMRSDLRWLEAAILQEVFRQVVKREQTL